jgi:hypothetical protein
MAFRCFSATSRLARRTLFPNRRRPALYDRSLFDDLLFGQPLNLLPRAAMARGRRRRIRPHGVTVVIVNYNTIAQIQVVLGAVRRFSPADIEIIVVDNASSDGSREWLSSRPYGIRFIRVPVNIGHGRALDIGMAAARTQYVVTLDSDAFPYDAAWLELLLAPLADDLKWAAGWRGVRDRLHPACAAFKRDRFFALRTSFANYNLHADLGEEPVFGVNTWDTGELLFERLGREHTHLLVTSDVAEFGGQQMANVVYHHCGMTTLRQPGDLRDPVAHTEGWALAIAALLRNP